MNSKTVKTKSYLLSRILREKCLIYLLLLVSSYTLQAQLTLSSGVVNRYGQVTAISGNTVTLGTESGVTHAWAVGDRVLLVQMTGNTSANGGKFEYATLTAVSGSNLTLSPITRSYSPTTEKVQLVWVPYNPTSITVPSGGILAQKWDGTTGGIVSILTPGTITLNGTVNADGAGFRYADSTKTINGADIYYGGAGGTNFSGPGGGGGGYGSAGKKGTIVPDTFPFIGTEDGTLSGGFGGSRSSFSTSGGGGGGAGVGGAGSGGAAAAHGGGGGGGAGYAGGGSGGDASDNDSGTSVGGKGSIGNLGDTDGGGSFIGGGGGGNRYVGGGGGGATGRFNDKVFGRSGTNGGLGGSGLTSSFDNIVGGLGGGQTPSSYHQYQYCDGSFNCPDPRIWMAGGGQNNTQGGGIVLLSANTIDANSKMISANGDAGSLLFPSYSASGGGGGGGGGLLVVNAQVVTNGPLQLCAKGGQGGQGASDDPAAGVNAHGGGGGGSGGGGLVWVQDPLGGVVDNSTGTPPIVPNLTFCVDAGPIAIAAANLKSASFTGVGGTGGNGAIVANNPCAIFGACNTCLAGTNAPIITSTTASNVCADTTVNLGGLANTGTKPEGTSLVWSTHNVPTSASDTLSNLTVGAGKYYALYYDNVNNCYSPADSVEITINACILANPNASTTILNTLVNIPVLGNDTRNGVAVSLTTVNAPTITVQPDPLKGSVTVKADGSIDFTPVTGFIGTVLFEYQICDKVETSICDTALVTVAVGCPTLSVPTNVKSTPSTICLGDTTILTADACASGTLTWYTDAGLTTLLSSTSVNPTVTTMYYAACVSGSCKSAGVAATVTVSTPPSVPSANLDILKNTCPTLTADLTSTLSAAPSGITYEWHSAKNTDVASVVSTPSAVTVAQVYYVYAKNSAGCYSPADSVTVQLDDCITPFPPLPPTPTACDYSAAPANVTLTVANEPAGYLKTYFLVDMANGQIVNINPMAPSFTGVNAGNYYVLAAYYADTLKDASIGKRITEVYSTSGCLKYSEPLAFRVCGACDYIAPATISFNSTPSTTAGVTTTYVLIDEKTNTIKAISGTASFAAVDTGYYAVVAVYRTKPINFVIGDILYEKVTQLDSCYEVSNTIHYRVCTEINLPPIAINDIFNTLQDKPVSGTVLTNDRDPEGGPLTVSTTPVSPPTKGTVVLNANGTFTYTPNPGVSGQDNFCYEITDNAGLKSTACVTINIVPAPTIENNPPIAADDATETYLNTAVVIHVKANDVDPDPTGTPNGTLGTPTKLTDPAHGTVALNPDGTYTYTPTTGYIGNDTFTYRICDNGTPSLCDTATVTVTILPAPIAGNKPPVAVDDANVTFKNTPVNGTVATNDFDPDNNTPLTFAKVSSPANGTVTFNADGTYTYTPNSDFVGSDVFTYKVCDSGTPVQCDSATVTLTILPPPVAKLILKVLLQGALYATSDGLMRDDLRRLNLLPIKEPYTALNDSLGASSTRFKHLIGGGETTTAAVFAGNVGTGDAIVDWVFVELRSPSDSTKVLQTASGLLQRDGDIVSPIDGTSPLTFTGLTSTAYFVSVKHRNHFGAMTNKAIPMTTVGTLVDFTVMDSSDVWNQPNIATLNYDGVEMNTTIWAGKKVLWAGNAVSDFRLKYDGANTDLAKPLNEVLVDFSASTYNFNNGFGYKQGDINMDGKVKYAGANNDIIYIQNNVLLYRLNTGPLYNFNNMFEQIP
jgi:hypothetical protein